MFTKEQLIKDLYELNVHCDISVEELADDLMEDIKLACNQAIENYAHELKETFNNEFPSNYPSVKPFFTLENVRILVDLTVKNYKH